MPQKYKVYINNSLEIITDNWENFCDKFTLIEAAGGLVYNYENQLLMIFRNGKWDLPKGKLEEGENIKECAIREVEEECGISGLSISRPLQDTYHVYELNAQKILKRTYWFEMKTDFKGNLTPQTEEGITKVCWVNKEDIAQKLENSFGNIIELLKA
ncbi:NUDIX domain-containing protein [Flavobacteriales bacterium]|jgi:8-oxo-dGTP pyrophosphatase MutT (NUDIX family)|nr:NUDIX domain-containing protein [Flavobacteriales bacterium]MDG1349086.1 NUDIX domain-containing protein [Flavobacteriales bacterium]